jgi:uncharacterized protein involved in outer membrane biogenesis
MRTFLKIVSGIVAVLVTLVLSLFLVINLVDWNKHRDFLIRNAERYTSIRIDELEGLRLQLWRSMEVEVARFKMHMADKDAALESFSTGPAQLRIATWPLIFKDQLLVQSLTLEGARLHLKEVKEKAEDKPAEDEASAAEILEKLPKVFINIASITDAQFRYASLEKKEPLKVSIERFQIEAPQDDPTPKLLGEGTFDDLPWKVEGQTGTLEAFQDEGKPFPFQLKADLGQQDLSVKGAWSFADGTGDFSAKAKGPDVEQIKKIFRLNMGRLPAYQIAFDSRVEPKTFTFSNIDIRLGKSEVNGKLEVDLRPRRPKITGKVESPVLTQEDFNGLFKTDERYKPANEPPKAPGQYFSDKVIDNSIMKLVDTDLRFLVNRYVGEKSGRAIHAWDATIKMNNGDLKIDPVKFAVASGHIGGRFLVDGRKLPLDVQIELGAKRINLNTLLGPLAKEVPVMDMKPSDMAQGLLTGQLDLKMKGKTPMEMARSVRGPIELAIEDGKLSGTVIEAFGIDITQTISNWFNKHPLYDIQCALTAFEAGEGAIKTKTFLLATKDTSIIGKGEVNLVANKVDFELKAHVHDFSVGSLRSPIEIKGPLNDFKVSLQREELLTRSGLAVALGALVNPIAALVPLIETGLDEKGKCRGVLAQLNEVQQKANKLSTGKSGRVTR